MEIGSRRIDSSMSSTLASFTLGTVLVVVCKITW